MKKREGPDLLWKKRKEKEKRRASTGLFLFKRWQKVTFTDLTLTLT